MNISTELNRDFYIKMRIKGYTHKTITENVFPPERFEAFYNDIKDLEEIDFTKKVNVDVLIETTSETKSKKTTKKNKTN